MTRAVRQINISTARREDAPPRPFSEFSGTPNIVLLGDPGAGKTHLFRGSAAAEQARFITARSFLTTPAQMLHGQALFIDGLDEKRAGRGDRDTVDAVVAKLFDVAPPKVRISCRAADWLGESDLAAMAPYFDQQGGACVLHLENLSRAEQVAVLAAQIVDADAAASFLDEAAERGLDDFLDNPQNLIMLWRAVQTGSWPATRKELFELSTTLVLQEVNAERARSGIDVFSVAELRPVAGALCAARLLSDVEGISLADQEGTADIPSYRSMDLYPPGLVQAALGRRVFDAASQAETVDYAHRTTAEYLAAECLASRVRGGLPFGRVAALMGVDGHPASELRGLHAWLAVHLPEHADEIIEADPYGVLSYGDAASLSTSSCAVLVRALDGLSWTNPWFRSGAWQAQPIGGLARQDMVGEFRAILNNPASGFGVRSVVVDALRLGPPLPAMLPDLQAVLARQASPFAERVHAFDALLRLGEAGRSSIRTVHDAQLGSSENDLRLRASVLQALYGDPYGPDAVIALVQALLGSDSTMTGVLWGLADKLPDRDLPAILDGIEPRATDEERNDREGWEAGSFYARILVRAWPNAVAIEPARLMRWLRKRLAFRGGRGESRAQGLRAAMQTSPERLSALAEDFFKSVPVDDQRWLAFHRFREATFFELSPEALATIAVQVMDSETDSGRRLFLYEVALGQTFQMAFPQASTRFDELYERAENDTGLRAIRDANVAANLPQNYFSHRSSRAPQDGDNRARQQQDFDRDIDQIRSGAHLGWLKHLAFLYFGLYSDTDKNLSPRDRIAAWLGEERVASALEALAATLSRNDLPGFNDVMTLTAAHQHYDWWYAALAGLNERHVTGQGFEGLSEDFLKGMLVFDLTSSVVEPVWRKAMIERRPELVRDAYLAVVHLRLSRKEQIAEGLRELLQEPAFEPHRPALIIDLLRQFPDADPFKLSELLDAVVVLPSIHQGFLQLAAPVMAGTVPVDERHRDLWLITAYLIAPSTHQNVVLQRAGARPGLVFDLRDRSGFARRAQPDQMLPLPMLEFMAGLTGRLFQSTPHPAGGWGGDTNAWDAAEHFRTLINRISASPAPSATEALQRLEADPQLASYKPDVLYALANQRQRRRDNEYDRPDWPKTVAALANRAPATVADLHALLVAQLRDLAHRIARDNTDIFKQFWNLDGYARPTVPRPEEACRDDVITLLKPALNPLGIMIEPEGHMVADKRADISAAMPGRKILCELKRDYHSEVWTALMGQLERYYAHDPDAKGFGIFVVFWFGAKRLTAVPMPPNGMPRPKTPAEMEAMLRSLLADDMRKRLGVIVIDVSGEGIGRYHAASDYRARGTNNPRVSMC
jgi:predicted NACHT family NTPase